MPPFEPPKASARILSQVLAVVLAIVLIASAVCVYVAASRFCDVDHAQAPALWGVYGPLFILGLLSVKNTWPR